jgi:hypothetical protein
VESGAHKTRQTQRAREEKCVIVRVFDKEDDGTLDGSRHGTTAAPRLERIDAVQKFSYRLEGGSRPLRPQCGIGKIPMM